MRTSGWNLVEVLSFLARRVLGMIPIVFGASLIVFIVGHLAPGDPVQILFGDISDPIIEARARASLGLDKPLAVQYLRFLDRLAHLDLGTSYAYPGMRIGRMIGAALPVSLELAIMAVLVAVAVGVPLGAVAALRRHSLLDRAVRFITVLGIAVPFFVIAVILVLVFSLRLRWLPVSGWGTPRDLVLPIVIQMLRPMAYLARITRLSLLQVLGEDYIRTARAKGLPTRLVTFRHALRNAAVTILTTAGLTLSLAFTGAFVTETIFGIPGMGRATVTAIFQRDYPMIQAVVLVYTGLILTLNLMMDLAYAVVDPRIRYA
ncbi:MAG TPA: ABC transporter permease [bacterium]|nr:ABC transporter permease [bacterium]